VSTVVDIRSENAAAAPPSADERRARRRAARVADNRADILDAAERTFAERGLSDGSLRDISKHSGFSTAAIYNYFENKQHLLAETLSRRGTELLQVITTAGGQGTSSMARLHQIIDGTVAFFERYPDFRQMLRRVRETDAIMMEALTNYAADRLELFTQTLALMTGIIEDGQRTGEIREGNPNALLHLYMTLVYEHVYISTATQATGTLTLDQFHAFIEGALRQPHP
jgi:AcrR family transcriptional regulator